jgi:dihydrofolate synthase/folylpolyglutamate synthase
VKIKTGLRGRWDLLQEKPTILADVGHNEGGLIETIQQLKSTGKKLHFVIGFVKDKDINKIITLFPKDATYYFCKPDLPRGLDVNELLQIASAHHLNGIACNRVSEALQKAKTQANADDIIYIGGSTFVVAEVL